jgi:hypothetical protein
LLKKAIWEKLNGLDGRGKLYLNSGIIKVKQNYLTKFLLLYSHHGSGLMRMMELIFTVIYCLIGLALISMGISLMQDQVLSKGQ